MAKQIKHLVSKKKRRFTDNGYDLDLTYIRPNILAMGFPSENLEGIYRNHLDDVVRFLDSYHGENYKVYNLCAERTYDASKFHGRVACFPFEDHNAPPFQLFDAFCKDVSEFLNADSRNVAAVHCKAGKGRTGVMICAFFIHENIFKYVPEALMFYDLKRTQNGKGVTIPSQRRYVEYYGYRKLHDLDMKPVKLLLYGFVFDGAPAYSTIGSYSVCFRVSQGKTKKFLSKNFEVDPRKRDGLTLMELDTPVVVSEDIKVEFIICKLSKKEKAFHFWLNTYFIQAATKHGDENLFSMRTSRLGPDMRMLPFPGRTEEVDRLDNGRRGYLPESPKFVTRDLPTGLPRIETQECDVHRSSPQQPVVVTLQRNDLDRAVKDKRVPKCFQVHCLFSSEVSDDVIAATRTSTGDELGVNGFCDSNSCQSVVSASSGVFSSSESDSESEETS